MNTPVRHTETWLKSSSHELETILKQVQELAILQQKISSYIDPAFQSYWQVANLSKGTLVLLIANGSIATQIRLQSLDILRKLHQNHQDLSFIHTIECKVRPHSTSTRLQSSKMKPAPKLSHKAADAIEFTAASMEDSSLKEIMMKIAKHRHGR